MSCWKVVANKVGMDISPILHCDRNLVRSNWQLHFCMSRFPLLDLMLACTMVASHHAWGRIESEGGVSHIVGCLLLYEDSFFLERALNSSFMTQHSVLSSVSNSCEQSCCCAIYALLPRPPAGAHSGQLQAASNSKECLQPAASVDCIWCSN
jgi:hypothetical protein